MLVRGRERRFEKPNVARGHRMFPSCTSINRDSVECHHHIEMILCSAAPIIGCFRAKTPWRTCLAEVRYQAANNLTSMI